MFRLFTLFIVLFVTGCATPDYNYRPSVTKISEPPLETINTVYIGDVLLSQGKHSEHDAIYLPQKIEVSWAFDLHAGYYLKKGEDENSETYLPGPGSEGGAVEKAAIADPWQAVMAYKDQNKICIITVFNVAVCTSDGEFIRKKRPVFTSDSFQQTLIYSGKVGNKINIGYREFSKSYARPAFNNDVEYDLSSSSIIGYKGSKLEIIEATNEYIKYRVIKNFNNAIL